MFRRLFVVLASLALAAPLAHAAEEPARLALRDSIARMSPRIDLTRLFDRLGRNGDPVETRDGVSAPMISTELVLARIGADGKPVMACVDNARSAERFFAAPAERLRKAENQ